MKKTFITLVICLLATVSYAQHSLEIDDGAGHISLIQAANTGVPLTTFTLPSTPGTFLTYNGTSSVAWLSIGNSGTNPTPDPLTFDMNTHHFIGTTDNKELDFVTNGQVRARFKESTGDTLTSGAFEPGLGVTYSLGSMDRPWKSLYVSPGTITFTSATGAHKPGEHIFNPNAISSGTLTFDVNTNTFVFDHPLGFTGGNGITASSLTISGLASPTGGLVKADSNGLLGLASVGTDFEKPLNFNNGLDRSGNTVGLGGSLSSNTTINGNSKNLYITNPGDFGIGVSTSTVGLLEVQCTTKTAFHAVAGGTSGSAADFSSTNAANADHAVVINNSGSGNGLDASTSGAGWAGHFNGSGASSKGIYVNGATGKTGIQVNNGDVILSHTNQPSGAFTIGAGTNAVVALSSGAGGPFNITLNTGTNGQIIYLYNGDAAQTASLFAGTSNLHIQNTGPITIAPGATLILIYVTNAAGSGWVTK